MTSDLLTVARNKVVGWFIVSILGIMALGIGALLTQGTATLAEVESRDAAVKEEVLREVGHVRELQEQQYEHTKEQLFRLQRGQDQILKELGNR